MGINFEEIKKIFEIEEIKHLKNLAIQTQSYELAAAFREHEKYLMTPQGVKWSMQERRNLKILKRKDKLNRIFLSE